MVKEKQFYFYRILYCESPTYYFTKEPRKNQGKWIPVEMTEIEIEF